MYNWSVTRRSFGIFTGITIASAFGAFPALSGGTSRLDAIEERGVLRIGWGVWVPYMFLDPETRELTGITVSLGSALGEMLGVGVEFVETQWPTMVAGMQAG